ncbi:Hypothetical protein, putative [Bodo saltans]|uniref:Uncharacterized protein n=1 Tax=Bodo saltans TaxID=75058 RepID=A0A0S4JHT3_BODSA|nr:Hypothetical protein, putative [Bodo saltans]|eukprot:CUG89922.1 Hypothetical protein, putative [Bodo saltans]
MRRPSTFLTSISFKKAGSWARPPTAVIHAEGRPSFGDVMAVACCSSKSSFDARQAVSQLTSSSALLTEEKLAPHTIRIMCGLLFHVLSRQTSSPSASLHSLLSGEHRFANAELLAALLTAQGCRSRGEVDAGMRAVLVPYVTLAEVDDPPKSSSAASALEVSQSDRCWSRTFIGGLINALKPTDEDLVVTCASPDELESPRPSAKPFLQLCVLSLCNNANEVRQWFSKPASAPCVTEWPLHTMIAAGSALRLLDDNKGGEDQNAQDYLRIIAERIAPLSKIDDLMPLDSPHSQSPIVVAAFMYLVAALSNCDAYVGEGARLLAKYNRSRMVVSALSHATGRSSSLSQPSSSAFLPSGLLHRLVCQQLVQVQQSSAVMPASTMIDVSTVVGLIQQERGRFDTLASSSTLSKFELAALQPKLAGDPKTITWSLRCLTSRLRSDVDNAAAVSQRNFDGDAAVASQILSVLTSVYPRSIVGACVPSGQPLETLLEANVQIERKNLVADLIGAIADAASAVIRTSIRHHDHSERIVAAAATLLSDLLSLWASKEALDSRSRKPSRTPLWKQRLEANGITKIRTHKMEVMRDELPHGILSAMCWDWLNRGFTAPSLVVLGTLLSKDFLDVHYYPLALLSSARCSVRLEPALLGPSETVKLSAVFHQRFSLFDEPTPNSLPLPHRHQQAVSSQLLVVEHRESLVYPDLHRMKQSAVVGPFGSTTFGYFPRSELQNSSGRGVTHRRPAVEWKSVSSAVVM